MMLVCVFRVSLAALWRRVFKKAKVGTGRPVEACSRLMGRPVRDGQVFTGMILVKLHGQLWVAFGSSNAC